MDSEWDRYQTVIVQTLMEPWTQEVLRGLISLQELYLFELISCKDNMQACAAIFNYEGSRLMGLHLDFGATYWVRQRRHLFSTH